MQNYQNKFDQDYNFDPALHFMNNIRNARRRMNDMLNIIEESNIPETFIQCPECQFRSIKTSDRKSGICPLCQIKMINITPHKNALYRMRYYLRAIKYRLRQLKK